MNSQHKVSVITVVYNSENYIGSTIESVINQDYSNLEYIIIDGGSKDSTISIIEKYKDKINHFISEKDSGIFDAMNKGLALANGEWIIYINSGDVFATENILSDMFESNIETNNYDLIYGDVSLFNDEETYFFNSRTNFWKINLNAICHQSVFIRKSIHPKFNLSYKIAADHSIIYDIVKSGRIYYSNTVISRILIGGVSSNLSLARLEKFRISFNQGGIIDIILALVIYCYNLIKELGKNALVRWLPYSVFQKFRSYKNHIEEL